MIFVLSFFVELLALFLLSKTLINLLFYFFYKFTRSKKTSIYLISILFFPGTLIHELSHYFMALLLQVPVGNMDLLPKSVDNGVKLGSVQIAKTDPLRRILIGLSPFLFGVSILLGSFFYATQYNLFNYKLSVIVISYLVFEIGNTMFSSKKDMEGALELVLTVIFLTLVFYFVGFRLPVLNPEVIFSNSFVRQILQKADYYLIVPVEIDALLTLFLRLLKH